MPDPSPTPLVFGADYNPEQWPESVWADDMRLMRLAGVTAVNLGVFSWGLLEVSDGEYDWGWLDRIMDLLHKNGIGVNLATATAAPPMWLLQAHPEIATVDEFGVRTNQGGRLAFSPSSATFRHYALRFVRLLAERYGSHPALELWHVSNELGNENARCYSPDTAVAWRVWLAGHYGDVDSLNAAWGTAFWGHHYTSFDQVEPPRFARTGHNPSLLLDFERFSSDALLDYYVAERDVLREVTPGIPITTNFMVMGSPGVADYRRWADEVDVVANDHYTIGADLERHGELSFSADRVRGMAGGRPWLLMEHSTSAVSWQPINRAKSVGELARNSLAHVARGADGVMFFQWRQSLAGSEQFHSAIVPHAGENTRVFREVTQLGEWMRRLAVLRGSTVERGTVALLFDQDSARAFRSGPVPSREIAYLDLPLAIHRALTARGIAVEVVSAEDGLDGFDLVIAPTLFLASERTTDELEAVVARGGHVLVSYLSGIVDAHNRVIPGGYPGAFRDLLGAHSEEFFPLFPEQSVALDSGATASLWTELLHADDALVLARYSSGELAGTPAITRRTVGSGSATYLGTRVDDGVLGALLDELIALAGIGAVADVDPGLEVVRRVSGERSWLFLINHGAAALAARASGTDLLSGLAFEGVVPVAAGAVVILEESL